MSRMMAIVKGGVRILAARPLSVLAWTAVYFVGAILVSVLLTLGAPVAPDPETGLPEPNLVRSIAMQLAMLMIVSIVVTAIYRAVLRPRERRFASLRVGADELRVFAVLLLMTLVFLPIGLLFGLLMTFLSSALMLASGGNPVIFALLEFGLLALFIVVAIFLWVRLSPILPLSYYRGRITVDGAWDLTRGRFWTLFGAYLIVWIGSIAVLLALLYFLFGDVIVRMMQAQSEIEAQVFLQGYVERQFDNPMLALFRYILFYIVFSAVFAVSNATMASATRVLLAGDDYADFDYPEEEI